MSLINKLLLVLIICVVVANATYDGPLPDTVNGAVDLIVKSIKDQTESRLRDELTKFINSGGNVDPEQTLMGERGDAIDGVTSPVESVKSDQMLMGARGDLLDESNLLPETIQKTFPESVFAKLKAIPNAAMYGGINAASAVRFINKMLPTILNHIKQQSIPNQGGHSNGFDWGMSNVRIQSLTVGGVDIAVGASSVTGTLRDLAIDLNLNWNYRRVGFPWLPWGSGSARVTGRASLGASFAIKAISTPITQNGYRPQVTIMNPNVNIAQFQISVNSGIFSWLYNIIIGFFNGSIRNTIANTIRDVFNRDANTMIETMIATMPLLDVVGDYGQIDLSLTQQPTYYQNSGVALGFNGEVYLADNKRTPNTNIPRPKMSYQPSGRMVDLKFSFYTLNTAASAWYRKGGPFINQVFTKANANTVPIPFASEGWVILLPQLQDKFPKAELRYKIQCVVPPTFPTLGDNSLTAKFEYTITLEAFHNSKWQHAITIRTVPTGGLRASIQYRNNMPFFIPQITRAAINLSLAQSSIGSFNVEAIGKLIDALVNDVLVVQINKDLLNGFPMPAINGIRFTSPVITISQEANVGYIMFASDLDYSPTALNSIIYPEDPIEVPILA